MCPAITKVSLLARRTYFPARAAEKVGRIPAAPTIAAITTSTSGRDATFSSDLTPHRTSVSIPFLLISVLKFSALSGSSITA